MTDRKKPELLCPASSLEVLKCAVRYGADAVYIGGEAFGLRAKAKNFSPEEMAEGIAFAHAYGVRVHVTANILAHNYDLSGAKKYFEELRDLKHIITEQDMIWVNEARESIATAEESGKVIQVSGSRDRLEKEYLDKWKPGYEVTAHPDALIVADPGMYSMCREVWPEAEIHISTQANNTNYETYKFWWKMGAKRVVSARELSLREIAEIRDNIHEDMEIESFIHGAMCISYSGRCLLSNFFTGRDANHGACTHPCRWKYSVSELSDATKDVRSDSDDTNLETVCADKDRFETEGHEIRYAIEEDSRPGEYLPVYENERGTYIFNSRDLCMIEHIPDLVNAGIDSWKIEGRMKTALYVATVARTYRKAIDDYFESPEKYEANLPWYREQIAKCTYRKFCTGFFYGKPDEDSQIYDNNTYSSDAVYLAMIEQLHFDGDKCFVEFTQKNKFSVGDTIEIMKADGKDIKSEVMELYHICTEAELRKIAKENKEQESKLQKYEQATGKEGAKLLETEIIEVLELFGRKCIKADSCPHAQERVLAVLSVNPEVGDLLRQPD